LYIEIAATGKMQIIVHTDSDLILQTMTLSNDRPVFSSERAPHMDRTKTFKQEKYLVMSRRRPCEKRKLRKIFGPKRNEIIGDWRNCIMKDS
jgi:hypothetical protein